MYTLTSTHSHTHAHVHTQEPVTAVTWAHNDEKLFVATNTLLHSVTIHRGIPSLQALCQATISCALPSKDATFDLVLPTKLKVVVAETFDPVIQVSYSLKLGSELDKV